MVKSNETQHSLCVHCITANMDSGIIVQDLVEQTFDVWKEFLLPYKLFAKAAQKRLVSLCRLLSSREGYTRFAPNTDTIHWLLDHHIQVHSSHVEPVYLLSGALYYKDEELLAKLLHSFAVGDLTLPLSDILEQVLIFAPSDFYQRSSEIFAASCSGFKPEKALHRSFTVWDWGWVQEKRLVSLLDWFRTNRWNIDWTDLFPERGLRPFAGTLSLLRRLIGEGLPMTKFLLIACAQGEFALQTIPWVVESRPDLLSQLTPLDIRRCFDHNCSSPATNCGYFFLEIFDLFKRWNIAHNEPWLAYLAAQCDRARYILREGWPCKECSPITMCSRPVCAAVGLNDTVSTSQLIKDGFAFKKGTCEHSRWLTPLEAGIERSAIDAVDYLLNAGVNLMPGVLGCVSRS